VFTKKRDKCCICLNLLENEDLIIKNVPIYMGTVLSTYKEDKKYDQKWVICKKCGCIQLLELIPLVELYSKNHSNEVVGKIWNEHHTSFAQFITSNNPKNLIDKFDSVVNCYKNLKNAGGYDVRLIDHTNTHEPLLNMIREYENDR
jgi:hypothetical protein